MPLMVRPAKFEDAEGITRVHVDTWRTTYKGIINEQFLANISFDRRLGYWQNELRNPNPNDSIFVAEDNDEIVGFASCGPVRENEKEFNGELYAIYVLTNVQGRGIGARLCSSVVQDLISRGYDSMLVWVLADNPFKRFYEKLGGKHVRTRTVEIGGHSLKEHGYGWKNLHSIVTSLKTMR